LETPLSWWDDLYPGVVDPEGGRTCPPGPEALRDGLLDALGIEGPLATLEQVEVEAALGPWEVHEARQEARVQLTHPTLGTWEGVVWTGQDVTSGPGLLMLHGHGQDGPGVLSSHGGQGLVDAGFTVLAMTHRSLAGFYRETIDGEREACEYWTALHLLETAGVPLLGPLLLEDLAALSALGALDQVDPDRLAVVGHSGGAHRARALGIVDPQLSALVVDYPFHSTYLGTCDDEASPTCDLPHCETLPRARPFGRLLNLAASLSTPVLELPYEDTLSGEMVSAAADFLTGALAP